MPSPSQRSIAISLFREPADEDYLVARWAAKNQLWNQFSWSGQQSLEKYMKCALAVNDVSVEQFSHDLTPIYERVSELAGSLLPWLLVPPNEFPSDRSFGIGHVEETGAFIARISRNGHSSRRYRQHNLTLFQNDVHKLDEVNFLCAGCVILLPKAISARSLPIEIAYPRIQISNPDSRSTEIGTRALEKPLSLEISHFQGRKPLIKGDFLAEFTCQIPKSTLLPEGQTHPKISNGSWTLSGSRGLIDAISTIY